MADDPEIVVYAGDRAPKGYELEVVARAGAADFGFVTEWELRVMGPDGKLSTWDATASEVTTARAVLTHVFSADGTDVPRPGPYDVRAILTSGLGQVQSDPVTLYVQHPYRPAF